MRRMHNGEIELDMTDVVDFILGMSLMSMSNERPNRARKSACACNTNKKCRANKEATTKNQPSNTPKITDFVDKIIAQGTATIIFWKDGTKTTVKCNSVEPYDYEKGIAMATLKYVFGNRYYKDIQKLMEAYPYVAVDPKSDKLEDKKSDKNKDTKEAKKSTKKETSKQSTTKKSTKAKTTVEKTDKSEKLEKSNEAEQTE